MYLDQKFIHWMRNKKVVSIRGILMHGPVSKYQLVWKAR